LPENVNELEFRGIKLGKGSADLHFHRTANGEVEIEMRNRTEALEVKVEPQTKAA
jgi:hypothetical protein